MARREGKENLEKSRAASNTPSSHSNQKTLLERLLRDADRSSPSGHRAFPVIADLTAQITNIEEELDSGGFADIHRGWWRNGRQGYDVAVKVLRVRKREDDGGVRLSKSIEGLLHRQRLGREIRAWHRLDHPNIVKLLGISYNVNGRPAMIMYWHQNGNATKYLAARKDSTTIKLTLVTDVARGLTYLHTLNPVVVHGDLKANNVLITEDGHAALSDFGLSQVIEDTVRPTGLTTTTAAGAIRWQAPEVMSGELDNDDTARLTTASDIWSFACTAYELLTGKIPYYQHRSTGPIVKAVSEGIKPRWEEEDGSTLCDASDMLRNLLDHCWSFVWRLSDLSFLSFSSVPAVPVIAPSRFIEAGATERLEETSSASGTELHSNPSALPILRNGVRPQQLRLDTKESVKWGYGWGVGKQNVEVRGKSGREPSPNSQNGPPIYQPSSRMPGSTGRSNGTGHPPYHSNDSVSTLVGSALERAINDVEAVTEAVDTTEKLEEIRQMMLKDNLDYYVIPSEDPHQSECVAASDKRREWISGFSGSAGQAVISKTAAYLVTDSRYWLQAQGQLDSNWHLVPAGAINGPKDWIEWLVVSMLQERVKDSRIGIDARMLSHEAASLLNLHLVNKNSKLVYPPQNFVDLAWKDKPRRPREPIYVHPIEFTGKDASTKLCEVRAWIQAQPPSIPPYSKAPAKPAEMQVATLITSLSSIAYLLNLRGDDIPYKPLFLAYLFVALDRVILFIDSAKVGDRIGDYLRSISVERREYNDLWAFLRKREWGEGKILLSSQSSYGISLMLTHYRYTISPSIVDDMKAIKNEVELDGMRRAYMRDGASFVKFLAWLDKKISQGFEVTEWEAAFKLTHLRKKDRHFLGLAYQNMSASGPNAAMPRYTAEKSFARTRVLDHETPYLNDSGGQYKEGACATARTVHFGRPAPDQREAYTRVLQAHIAFDCAVFPEGTTGAQLDVLTRRPLRTYDLNHMYGTAYGFSSSFHLHDGTIFSGNVSLAPGHVIINETSFYEDGKWGIRIKSALALRRVNIEGPFGSDTWLGFERLTCVPLQTRMVKESMLSKEEKQWLKNHNQRCREILEPHLRDDKIALRWLKREAERGISGPGGISMDSFSLRDLFRT